MPNTKSSDSATIRLRIGSGDGDKSTSLHVRLLNQADVIEKSERVTKTTNEGVETKHTFAFVNFDKKVMIKVRRDQSPRRVIEGKTDKVLLNQIRYLRKTAWKRQICHPLARIFQPHKWSWKKTGVELLEYPKGKNMQEHVAFICIAIQ